MAYVKELNAGKEAIHDPVYYKGTAEGIEVEAAFQFVDTFEENILGFCNNIFTQEGGTHLVGFKTRFTPVSYTHLEVANRTWELEDGQYVWKEDKEDVYKRQGYCGLAVDSRHSR